MINPNEAPEGFVAVATPSHGWACKQCCLYSEYAICIKSPCRGSLRKDGESVIFIPREQSNLGEFSNIGDLAEARAEASQWKLAHDQVCRKFADCENARDENAKLCEEAQEEAARWKAACLERDELIAKLKAQLTAALESIARMR